MNKITVTLLTLIALASCGRFNDPVYINKNVVEEKEVFVKQKFEGVFYLQNNSTIELITDSEGKVTIDTSIQVITSKNPQNGTFGEHPRISGSNLLVKDGKVRWSSNVNYTTGNDIEQDVSGANITGQKRTDYLLEFVNGKLKLTISIWQDKMGNNVNNIVAKRSLKEI